jgi:hypothetical protein
MHDDPDILELEKRLGRIEQRLVLETEALQAPSFHPAWPLALGLISIVLGYLSVGLPHHYYQVMFSVLLLLLLYHRGSLVLMPEKWKWPLIVMNFVLLCLLFQLLIGGGISHPFDWIKVPAIIKSPPPAGEQSWYSTFIPDYTVQWQAIPKLGEWSIDVTKIQSFLLLAILAGALFRFEPFTSITALALLVISLPVYLRFNWDWVVLFIILGSVTIYLQAGKLPRRY